MIAIMQTYEKETVDRYIDALDHIMRVCRNTDIRTKRLLWIEKRADCAINGSEDWREYDYPKVRKAAKENIELRERITQLEFDIKASAGLQCPNTDCNNRGWYPVQVSEDEFEQAQCEFCNVVDDSIFNRNKAPTE